MSQLRRTIKEFFLIMDPHSIARQKYRFVKKAVQGKDSDFDKERYVKYIN